jgi:hypothetical protein
MQMPFCQREPILPILLTAAVVPISQRLARDSLLAGYLRDRAMRQFWLGQVLEHVVDLSVRVHMMHMLDHSGEGGNHPESDLVS